MTLYRENAQQMLKTNLGALNQGKLPQSKGKVFFAVGRKQVGAYFYIC